MSAKSSPKIVKVDLQPQAVLKKSKRKIQGPKKKYLSPQKLQKTFASSHMMSHQKLKQQSAPQFQQSHMISSEVQSYPINQFSFSQQSKSHVKRIQGDGYEILFNEKPSVQETHLEKMNFTYVNMVLKLFELCNKNYENESLVTEDLEVLGKNLNKHLKAVYGGRNEQLIIRKEVQLKQGLKLVFYRKKSVQISQLLLYLLDCQVVDQILSVLMDIFPKEVKEF